MKTNRPSTTGNNDVFLRKIGHFLQENNMRILFLLFLLSPSFSIAQDFDDGFLKYHVTSGTTVSMMGEITPFSSEKVVVPGEVAWQDKTYTVTEIGEYAFTFDSLLTEVVLPQTIEMIGDMSFCQCLSLASINFPENLKGIGFMAFQSTAITELIIPNSVSSIDDEAFGDCTNLKHVVIGRNMKVLREFVFFGCASLTEIDIPDNITTICEGTFARSGLKEIHIPANVTSIDPYAFRVLHPVIVDVDPGNMTYDSRNQCNAIMETATNTLVTGFVNTIIPDDIEHIGGGAFSGLSSPEFTTIHIPEGVISIGQSAFSSCEYLDSMVISRNVTAIDECTFSGCHHLRSVALPEGLKEIKSYAFTGCQDLNSIDIPHNVSVIGKYAFWGCSNLSEVLLPQDLTLLDDYAFINCTSLTGIVIPENTKAIRNRVFDGCSQLKSFVIEDSDKSLECHINAFNTIPVQTLYVGRNLKLDEESYNFAFFSNMNSLRSVSFGDKVTSVPRYAFACCRYLSDITFSNSIKEIGFSAFLGCKSLKSLVLPANLSSMGDGAFDDCPSVSYLQIPGSLEVIPEKAFFNCSSIEEIVIPSNMRSVRGLAFGNCKKLKHVVFECNADSVGLELYQNCFSQCNIDSVFIGRTIVSSPFVNMKSLSSVIIDDGVSSVCDNFCKGCEKLKEIHFPAGIKWIGKSAFEGSGLVSVDVPDNVTIVYQNAFKGCKQLTNATIGKGVLEIGENTFSGCDSLKTLVLEDGNAPLSIFGYGAFKTTVNLQTLHLGRELKQTEVFRDTKNLASVTIGDSVSVIKPETFHGCKALKIVVFGKSLRNIGWKAFTSSGLEALDIPDWVETIGMGAFWDCSQLASVHLPSNLKSISQNLFVSCSKLTAINIPDSVEIIEDNAFYNCILLEEVNGMENLKELGIGVFCNCTNLTRISLPTSLESLGWACFAGCILLDSIVIPDKVGTLPQNCFEDCTSLSSIVLGENMNNIEYSGINNCLALKAITILNPVPPYLDYRLDREVAKEAVLVVPNNCIDAYKNHGYWKHFYHMMEVDEFNSISPVEVTKGGVVVFTLDGIKVAESAADMNTLPPGIYITNGKKIVIK